MQTMTFGEDDQGLSPGYEGSPVGPLNARMLAGAMAPALSGLWLQVQEQG